MTKYQKRALQAFRRVQAWLVAHPDIAAASDANAQSVQNFNTLVAQFTSAAGDKDGHDRGAHGAAQDTQRARTELIVHQMRHVAVVAEATIPDVVKMTVALRRPVKQDNESLLAEADAMATAAKTYEPALIARGLEPAFVQQLRDAAETLRQAIDARGASIAARHKAGETLSELVKSGARIVETLSVVLQRKYRNDSATLAEWKQLRRVTLPGPRPVAAGSPVVESAAAVVKTAAAVVKTASAVPQGASEAVKPASEVLNIAPPVTNGASEVPKAAAA
jgi:hypothetical protein